MVFWQFSDVLVMVMILPDICRVGYQLNVSYIIAFPIPDSVNGAILATHPFADDVASFLAEVPEFLQCDAEIL